MRKVGGEAEQQMFIHAEAVRTVELIFGLRIVAVAPGAAVMDVIQSGFRTHIKCICRRESLPRHGLDEGVAVGLAVFGRPADAAGRPAFSVVVPGFHVILTAFHNAEKVESAAELPEVIVLAELAVTIFIIALVCDSIRVGGEGQAVGESEIEPCRWHQSGE